jgi:HD superfamily phosphodiesterase
MSHLVDEARSVAQTHLEVSRPARWQHVTAVAGAAERLATLLDAPGGETVVTAAWLHDIGHAPGVRDTGFHALDGARFLTRMRRFPAEVIALVAHPSCADSEHRNAATAGLRLSRLRVASPSEHRARSGRNPVHRTP